MSSDLGPDCEEILAGRPFYLRAGMSVSTGMAEHLLEHERERECESEGGQGGERVCERRTLPRRRQSRAALSLLTSGRCMQLSGRAKSDLDARTPTPLPSA